MIFPPGTQVRKHFPNHGWFEGKVTKYDQLENLYHIVYKDGDTEQLTHKEVNDAAPSKSVKVFPVGTAICKHFANHGWFEGTVTQYDSKQNLYRITYTDGDIEVLTHREVSDAKEFPTGTIVRKHFPNYGWFKGTVTQFNPKENMYKITYSDGDVEQMTHKEVKSHQK